ncbi:hypothetical protein [Thermomonospora umbrina]|uniref:Uncharacterized protein n=1 Tax=Thermomonospora umbrina TaxID=111806 RepID=A0A3D9T9U2_9ACTN|nr:hypothetical protein [Thermomonospora umbrina]REF00542.1 hypothetical protein DFJ69_6090 [Thermomonospora umbrina]
MLSEWFWNRMRASFSSLTSELSTNMMCFDTTPIAKYPPVASRHYGEWRAHRAELVDVVALVIGNGAYEDVQRAQRIIDQWIEGGLTSSDIAAALKAAPPRHAPDDD